MTKNELSSSLICFFIFLSSLAQELPPIQNFSPDNYYAGNQNWMISQSADRNIFIANNSGLLEFNGAKWKLNTSLNGSVVRSVKVIDGLIYTGCYMDFGFWEKDLFGDLNYTSLIPKLHQELIEDEQFWNIQEFRDWILFQSLDRIYIYNTKKETFNIVEAKSLRANIFIERNTIYFQKLNEGIFKIENGKSVVVIADAVVKENNLIGTFIINENIVFLFENGAFYKFSENKLIKWNIPADSEIGGKKIYCSLQLADNSIVLGTISNGIYQLNSNGKIIRNINRRHGLLDNTILSIFEDAENNLWLGLDNGVSVLNLKSHFSINTDSKGELGVVYASIATNDYLYLGTNQGLFYRPVEGDGKFQLISGTEGQVWSLDKVDATLFCGHNKGTFVVDGIIADKISDFPGTWGVKKVPSNQNLLLQGNYEGLSILEKLNGQWQFRNKIEGFDIPTRFFEFVENDQIIINHDQKGIFILDIDKDFEEILNIENSPSYGYGSSLVKHMNDIIYTSNSSRGVYKFNSETKKFIVDSVLTNTFYKKDEGLIGILISDHDSNKLWGFSDRNIICVSQGKFSNAFDIINVPITASFRRKFGLLGFESLTHLGNEIYLIGTSSGYLYMDINTIVSGERQIKIDAIKNETLDGFSQKVLRTREKSFNSNENNFKVNFSDAHFDKYSEVEYQYQLIGIYHHWSSWSNQSEIELNNLSFGSYKLNIKSRIGDQLSSNMESFSFKISKPWYLTNFSLIIYSIAILLFSFGMHKIYKVYYTREKQREIKRSQRKLKIENLKNEKEIMRIKNENLYLDIESRNREVGSATMTLIRKNEFLGSLKSELKKTKSLDNLEQIIKIVDENLNSTDDWKLFKKAFTNADKDFFDKIKKIHPSLTPNDLKLCAYLRLNLSSKEIAQLLNISTRSVEIKRYRLRKKIELPSENNLSQYISEI